MKDLGQFQDELDKTLIVDATRKGANAKEACAMLGIATERYRHWFETDLEFRVRLYAAVSGTSVGELLASVDDES
jgi:hypothetical protein